MISLNGKAKKPTPENYVMDVRLSIRERFTPKRWLLIWTEALLAEITVA